MLTKREIATKKRINNASKVSDLLYEFFGKGFKSLPALCAISQHYYPEMTIDEINNFWHFRNVSDEIVNKMENVLEQLKQE